MVRKLAEQGRVKGKIGIVASKFNEFITKRLLEGCLDELNIQGVRKTDIIVVWVPGAFEIPVVALKLAKKKSINAVICLGAVIRGETFHFEIVAQGAAFGIGQASLLTEKPIILGILTTDTVTQAYKRSQKKGENKGREAAMTAIDMGHLLKAI